MRNGAALFSLCFFFVPLHFSPAFQFMRAANSESLNNWHVNANDFITPTLHTAYMPKGFTFHGNSASVAIFTAAAPCSAQRSSHQRRRQTPAKEKQSKQYNLFSFVVSSDSVRVCVRTPPLISAQVTSLAKWLEFKSVKVLPATSLECSILFSERPFESRIPFFACSALKATAE